MAREGIYFFLPFLALAVLMFYLYDMASNMNYIYTGVFLFVFGLLVMLFFRDPERNTPDEDGIVISPADGKIVGIEKSGDQIKISIFLSIFDVHINRIPFNGIVSRLNYRPGKFFSAFKDKASSDNERFEIAIDSANGKVTLHQIAGLIARRVVCRLKQDQKVKTGDRFGLIRFGSRVDIYLPPTVQIEVKMKQKVKGAETIIGRFV